MMRITIVYLACSSMIVLGTPACARHSKADSAERGGRPAEPQRAFREFVVEYDPEATVLYESLVKRPDSIDVRMDLSRHYASVGYLAVSQFFKASADVLKGKTTLNLTVDRKATWLCAPPDDRTSDAIREIDSRLGNFDFGGAYSFVKTQRFDSQSPCPLVVEASLATIAAATTNKQIPAGEFEKAVRGIITADLESGLRPYQGSAEWPYELLAEAFYVRGDPASSFVAAKLALSNAVALSDSRAREIAIARLQNMLGRAGRSLQH